MAATRQPVKIFLASSAELKAERERIEQFISRLNGEWADDGIILNLRIWEDANHGGSLRSQDDYNRDLAECGIFLMLFYSKVGKYTREEFEKAKNAHVEEGGLPKLFIFQKDVDLPRQQSRQDADSRFEFLEILNEPGNEHFPFLYKNPDGLINELGTRFRRLHAEGFFGAKKKIVVPPPSPHFLTAVPRPDFFTGREELLADLHQKLEHDGAVALVRGIGGIGKTTAVLEYLHRDAYGGSYNHVAWLEISTTLPDAFARQSKLHEKLGIRPRVEELLARNDLDEVVRATLDALDRLPGQNILVLDNANDRDEIRRWKRALTDSSCRLLLTSRAEIPNVADVLVAELGPADGARLFYHHYRPTTPLPTEGDEVKAVMQLLSAVQHHTLLIEMLGKIGKQATLSVADLVNHVENGYVFSDKLQRTVSTGSLMERKAGGMDESTLENLVLFLFQGLAPGLTDAERNLLRQIAVLPPTAHAPKLLARLFGVAEDKETDFFNALDGLDKCGIPLKKDDAYQLHHLVRAVALHELTPTPENCAVVLQGVTNLLSIDQIKDNPVDNFPFVGYGEALLEAFGENDVPEFGVLQNNLAVVYQNLGNYERSLDLLEAAIISAVEHFGADHPTIAISQSNLANVYRELGNYERAKELLEAALFSDLKNFGADHPSVAICQCSLGLLYKDLSNYERAKELLEAALASGLKNFGADHPTVAKYQSNLATLYYDLSDYEQARDLLETALSSKLKNFGADHPSVANSQSSLATVYYELGDYERAGEQLEAVLSSNLKNLGADHPNIAVSQSNLAKVYRELGNYERVRELLEAALTSDLKNFGPNHPSIATRYNNLAAVEIDVGNWLKAKRHLQQALSNGSYVWGEQHPNVQKLRQALAYVESHLQKN